jgi:DNA-binding response OmpR family regulator
VVRVLIATDNDDLREALRVYLTERRVVVVGVVADLQVLLSDVGTARPHVVLIDWRLGATASARAVGDLRSQARTPAVILCPARDHERASGCGAAAVATLGDAPAALIAILEKATQTPR